MSVYLSPPGGGGGGGGGSKIFCVSLSSQLLSTKLSFSSVILFVVSSSTSSRFRLTSPIHVQLQLFVCKSDYFVFSKGVFGRRGAPSCVR